MAYSLKKLWAALSVSLVAATSLVGASTNFDNNGCAQPCPCPCPCPCPTNACCGDFWFSGDALFWRACEDGLTYGTEERTIGDVGEFDLTERRVKNIHPNKWHTGFRLGLGWNRPCSCIDVAVYWTHFRTHANARHEVETLNGITTTFIPAWGETFPTTTPFSEVDASWKVTLDVLDFEFGREICACSCITIRPFVGVRGAWIRQSYDIEYQSFVSSFDTTQADVHLSTKFTGGGVRGGLDSEWDLGCGVSLYGQVAAALLYGNFEVQFKQHNPASGLDFAFRQKDEFCACRAVTDTSIGLRWKSCYCNDCVTATIQLGWEHHMFFNQNRFEDYVSSTRSNYNNPQIQRGDLCFSGLTLGAKVDF